MYKLRSLFILSCFLLSNGILATDINVGEIKEEIKEEVLSQINLTQNLKDILNEKAQTPIALDENDTKALRLLGYSDEEISSLTLGDIADSNQRQKLADRVNQYANKKNTEINEGLEQSVVPGLASAVIGLAFSSLLGVVIGVKCSNQPSALAFAGTSAAWAALEMMIWKGYQVNMDDIQTLVNATEIPKKITKEVDEIKAIIKSIEDDIKTTGVDNYDSVLERNKPKLKQLQEKALALRDYLNKAKDSQFGAVRSIQESLELAAETSKKKAKNAKIAAIGFTAAAGIATAETFKAFGDGGKCFNAKGGFIPQVLDFLSTPAYAGFASIGDLDKIGIPLGAGLGVAYLGFEKTFANQIFNSAPSRAAIFLAMAGIAYYASVKLEEASEFLAKQAAEMDIFATSIENALSKLNSGFNSVQELINEIKTQLLPAFDDLLENVKNNQKVKDSLAALQGKIEEAKANGSTDQLKSDLSDELKTLVNQELNQSESDIQKTINEGKADLSNITSSEYLTKTVSLIDLFDFLIPDVHASFKGLSINPSCFKRGKNFPVMDENCSCLKNRSCMSSRFPSQLKVKNQSEFVTFVSKQAYVISQANDLILSGRPKEGLSLYKKSAANTLIIEKNSLSLLNSRKSKFYSSKNILKLSDSIRRSSKEGLGTYFKDNQNKMSAFDWVRPPSTGATTKRKLVGIETQDVQNLDNSISENEEIGQDVSSRSETEEIYNYSQETIIRDPNVDIFQMIKKRYMHVQASGRL